MKYLGNFVAFVLLAVNALFAGVLLFVAYSPFISPIGHPVAACAGLVFPLFALLNGCFLLFWGIVRHYRSALLPLVTLLLCYPQLHTYFPLNFQTQELPSHSFTLLSYNVMGFNGGRKVNGENPILNYLKNSKADILCLQEFHASTSSKHRLTLKEIEQTLKEYPYRRYTSVGSETGYANKLACFSKYPILSAKRLKMESAHNGSAVYEVKIGEDTITLVNNHLESNKLTVEDKDLYRDMMDAPEKEKVQSGVRQLMRKLAKAAAIRAKQADEVAQIVATSKHPHVVVCGDFNDTPISYTHRVAGKSLNDVFAEAGCGLGISYHGNRFYFRIDHIFASKQLQAYQCEVDRSIDVSDHYPVRCSLAFKE